MDKARKILENIEEKGSRGLRLFLSQVQEGNNWVAPEYLQAAAEHFEKSLADITEAASFQPGISLQHQGETLIEVCRGHACNDAHSADVLADYEHCLGIKANTTSEDGKHSLKAIFCFGRCAIGPNVRINGTYHSNQKPGDAGKNLK